MAQRVITGTLGGIVLLAVILAGGIWYAVTVGLLVTLALLEYAELLKKQSFRPQTQLLVASSLIIIALLYIINQFAGSYHQEALVKSERLILLSLFIMFITIAGNELLCGKSLEQGFYNVAINLFGAVYIGFMFAYILLLRYIPVENEMYALFTILVTWANDTTAFFIGTKFGKHKLSPRISPKKSIEGSIGGLAGGLVIAVLLGFLYRRSLLPMLILGTLVVIAGQFGDLVESIIKRNIGVKDSGSFLPGHGGVLDRFDSLLIAAPVAYYTVVYLFPYFKII